MRPSVVYTEEQLKRSVPALQKVLRQELGIHTTEDQAVAVAEIIGLLAADAMVAVMDRNKLRREQEGERS